MPQAGGVFWFLVQKTTTTGLYLMQFHNIRTHKMIFTLATPSCNCNCSATNNPHLKSADIWQGTLKLKRNLLLFPMCLVITHHLYE